jgi:hypothetical protein
VIDALHSSTSLTRMRCVGWFPVKRTNPRSTMRGLLAVELVSGMIVADISVLSTGNRHWVQVPARLKLDPVTNRPIEGDYRREPVIEFNDRETRKRCSDEAVAALLREFPAALDEEDDL